MGSTILEKFNIEKDKCKEAVKELFNQSKTTELNEELKKTIKDQTVSMYNLLLTSHGLYKEANASSFIRKNYGHNLKRSDIVPSHYTNLNDNIALTEYSSKENLGKASKIVNTEALGIYCNDKQNPTNIVDGRLIDYGGFSAINKTLATNPVARRTYKKIQNTGGNDKRINYWNETYKKVKENKIANSIDIKQGLKEALKLIPKEQHNKSIDIKKFGGD